MSLQSKIALLVERWESQGVELVERPDEQRVREIFTSIACAPAADAVLLYKVAGGMTNMDNEYWRLWPLEEVQRMNSQASDMGVLFADYCLDSYQFRLKPGSDAESEVWAEGYGDGPPVIIARSLDAFFGGYLSNPDALLCVPVSCAEYDMDNKELTR